MINRSRFLIVYILLIGAGLYVNLHAESPVPINKPFSTFPSQVGGWRMVSEMQFSKQVLDVLKPADYLSRSYTSTGQGREVEIYIGYHDGAKGGGGVHSPKHCLPGSGWYEASSRRTSLEINGNDIDLVEAVYQKGETKVLLYYWFQVQEKTLPDEYSLKLAEIFNSMLHQRKDAAFVRISVPFQGERERALATGGRFIRDFYPLIKEFLPM